MKDNMQSSWLPIGMCLGLSIGTAIGAATKSLVIYTKLGVKILTL